MVPRYKTKMPEDRDKRAAKLAIRHVILKRRGNRKDVLPMLTTGNPVESIKVNKAFVVTQKTYIKHGYASQFSRTVGGGENLRGWRIRKVIRSTNTKRLLPVGDIIDLRNKMPIEIIANLSSKPIRKLILDEVDRFPLIEEEEEK